LKALVTASYLHDIGKLAVPEHIIDKPGKLTQEEFEKIKIHPVVGADILERVQFPYPVVPIVRSHHEAWDGSGYPDGLKGEEIPIGARILTVVDCFDALASDRPYRKAMPLDQAITVVSSKAGGQFDPEVVRLLEEHYPQLEKLARQEIEEMAPLNTDLRVKRGVAPGAGFQSEAGTQIASYKMQEGSVALNAGSKMPYRSLSAGIERGQEPESICSSGETWKVVHRLGEALTARLERLLSFEYLALYFKSGESIYAGYVSGFFDKVLSAQPIPLGEGLSGWVAMHQRPILNGNPTVEPNLIAATQPFTADSSAISLPLVNGEGSVFAVLTLYSLRPAAFSKEHLRILEEITSDWAHLLVQATLSEDPVNPSEFETGKMRETVLQGVTSR
jgi:putative nucleotidyltransferase with HDIG domain